MRKLMIIAGMAALTACNQAEETPTPEPVVEEPQAPLAVDGGPLAGSYNAVAEDGTNTVWTLNEDGTFTATADGADPVSGTYSNTPSDTGSTFCADSAGDEEGEVCFAIGMPGEDGSWSSTDPDGNVLTVTRAEG